MAVTGVQSLDTGGDEFQIVFERAGTRFNLIYIYLMIL